MLEEPQTSGCGLCDPSGGTPSLHCVAGQFTCAQFTEGKDLQLGLLPWELSTPVVLKLKSKMGS